MIYKTHSKNVHVCEVYVLEIFYFVILKMFDNDFAGVFFIVFFDFLFIESANQRDATAEVVCMSCS